MSTVVVTHDRAATRPKTRDLVVAVIVLVIVGGVIPVLIAGHFGALGIPRNDDWAYSRALFQFVDRGTIDGGAWIAANLVGQLVASVPIVWVFGDSIQSLQLATVVSGVVGLVAVLDLAMRLMTLRRALFVALLVAVGPMWASLTVSYMTDVPAFTLGMLCLAVGARSIRSDGIRPAFFLALLLGVWGFTVREYAIVAPLAVGLTALWVARQWSRAERRRLVVTTTALCMILAGFYLWRLGLPNWYRSNLAIPGEVRFVRTQDVAARSALLIGLLVSPAVAFAGPWRTAVAAWRRAPRATLAAVGAVTAWLVVAIVRNWTAAQFLGPGNYLDARGSLGGDTLSGDRQLLLGRPWVLLLVVLGAGSFVVLVCHLVPAIATARERARAPAPLSGTSIAVTLVAVATAGYAGSFVLANVLSLSTFDRYLLPLVPLVSILVMARAPRPVQSVDVYTAGAAFVALAALGATFVLNSASYDGTKWRVAERANRVAQHTELVDGGYEWIGHHGYFEGFDRDEACIRLTATRREPADDAALIAAERVWGPTRPQGWIVARQIRRC